MAVLFDADAVQAPIGHFIAGEWVHGGGAVVPVIRPSDGAVHAELREAETAHLDAAVAAARAAQARWRLLPPRDRGAVMKRWADLVDANRHEIARLEALVSSRTYVEAAGYDVPAGAEWIRFYGEYADKYEGSVTATDSSSVSLVTREPYGVVAAITPWNFPVVLSTWKVAPAIAAGNAVVIKPSELTPFSVARIAELGVQAGLPAGLFNVLQGRGHSIGAQLIAHPGVDYVTFTGSSAVGAQVMSTAAHAGMKPVSLELGGKSPQVVFDDVEDLDLVAEHVHWGITRNCGQICYAGSRLVVHEGIADALCDRIAAKMRALSPGPTWDSDTTLAPVISQKQAERIEQLVQATVREGGLLHTGGERSQRAGGHFFSPTILTGVRPGMSGHDQEIFGPVLAVQTFRTFEEAIALGNHARYGLTASVFTRSVSTALQASHRLRAGLVWVNRWGRTNDMMTAPYGGVGESGFGKESGRLGLETFLRNKSVWLDIGNEPKFSPRPRVEDLQ